MEELTLLEKFQIIFDKIFSTHYLINIIGFMILILGTYLISRRKHNKIINILIGSSWLCYFIALLLMITPKVSQIIAIATQQILTQYYFPSILTIFFIFIITYYIGLSSFFKKNSLISRFNQIMFVCLNILFSLLFYEIINEKIDITTGILLYKNKQLLSILELITLTFTIFLFLNFISWITSKIMNIIEKDQKNAKDR